MTFGKGSDQVNLIALQPKNDLSFAPFEGATFRSSVRRIGMAGTMQNPQPTKWAGGETSDMSMTIIFNQQVEVLNSSWSISFECRKANRQTISQQQLPSPPTSMGANCQIQSESMRDQVLFGDKYCEVFVLIGWRAGGHGEGRW
jgi:hypothetical protein